jgi:peptidoglycan/LPS O-acetylase OafA/YrhL
MLGAVPQRAPALDPAVAPPPGNPRFPLFDGLRAIAALSIVVTHASGLTTFGATNDPVGAYTARLNAGVAVFFVISGFLLYRPFVAARLEGTPRPSFGRFWWRRALRILPAYWVALVVLSIWPGLDFGGQPLWRYVLLLQNLSMSTIQYGIGPAWSLCIEAQFYLLLPFLALAAARAFGGRRHALAAELTTIALLAVASAAARTAMYAHDPGGSFSYQLPGTFLWFAPGMALAVLSAHWHAAARRPAWATWLGDHAWVCWAGAFAALTLATQIGLPRDLLFRYSERTWLGEHLVYGLFGALLVLPAVVGDGRRGAPQALLGSRVMAYLGLVSYGIFLYHLPIAPELLGVQDHAPALPFLIYTTVLALAAIAYGAASHRFVERPALRLKDRRRGRPAGRGAPEPAR